MMLTSSMLRAVTGIILLYRSADASSVSERPPLRLNLVRDDNACVDANSLHATFACADLETRRNGWSLYGNGGKYPCGMFSILLFSHTERNQEMKIALKTVTDMGLPLTK